MFHMLPHLPPDTPTRSLSPTSLAFRPFSPSLSCPTSAHSGLNQETLRDPRRGGGYGKSASPTGYDLKLIQSDDFELRRIELYRNIGTDLQAPGIELDRNIGTDPFQIPEFWEMTFKILSQKIRRRLENLMSTCPTSNQGYTQTTILLKAVQTRILKVENYKKKCWLHLCICKVVPSTKPVDPRRFFPASRSLTSTSARIVAQ